MDKILFRDDCPIIHANDVAEAILDRVKSDNLRVSIVWEPNHTELSVEPWEPLNMECPYSNKKGE